MDLNLGYTQKLIAACHKVGYLRNQTAYLLATSYWETGRTMRPVAEAYYLGSKAETWRKSHLRYYPHYGRGFVQLTWPVNYKWAEEFTGQPISTNLDLALDPDLACAIIVEGMRIGKFTGHKLSDYVDLQHSDFVGARHVINGSDKAQEIAKIAQEYDNNLKAIWQDGDVSKTPVEPSVVSEPPKHGEAPVEPAPAPVIVSKKSIWDIIFDILIAIFKR